MHRLTSVEQKAGLLRSYIGRHPMWVAWQVTYRCNFKCAFCGYWKDWQGALPEQTVDQFSYGASQMARAGSIFISLAGGEPLLRDDIVEIVRVISRWHLPFITTNGYLMTQELAEELYQAGLWGISISLDYADAEKHDRRRGMKGAFAQAVRALEYIAKAGRKPWQRANLMSVLMHDNLDEIEPLIKLARDVGAYFMVQPYSHLKTGDERFLCREPNMVERLLELRRKYPNMLSNPYFLSNFSKAMNGGVPGCMAGRAFYNIDSVGDVAICVERRTVPVGNLYRDNIFSLYAKMKQESKKNTCQACWYNCRGELESLYHPYGLFRSLPTYFFDRGKVPDEVPVW